MNAKEPVRAVVAVGLHGTHTVIATDSPALAGDMEGMGTDDCDDLGIKHPDHPPGLHLWTGTAQWVEPEATWQGTGEPYMDYRGTARVIEPGELAGLLAMKPPPSPCVVCGKPATTAYPDDDGEPSCGRAECEVRMQEAQDYHDERGG